jgi:hypothetical protein
MTIKRIYTSSFLKKKGNTPQFTKLCCIMKRSFSKKILLIDVGSVFHQYSQYIDLLLRIIVDCVENRSFASGICFVYNISLLE